MPVNSPYFRFRGRFAFSPNYFEIGNPIVQNKIQADNFFLKKLYQLTDSELDAYYNFHLAHFLETHPGGQEAFFKHVHDIVVNRLKHFKRLDPFSPKYARGLEPSRKLEAFLGFLKTIDRWHKTEPMESVIGEKDKLMDQLKLRIIELEAQLKESTKYDAGEKIVISKGNLPAFIDLMQQLQDLTLTNGNKLLRSQAQSPWYKLLAKYFMHSDKDISIETARNYFPAQKDDKPAKFIEIAEKDKLFRIEPVTKK
jgi:hypothetical protein